MKCSAIKVNGEWRDVYKNAPGKKSKRGLLDLIYQNGYETVQSVPRWDSVLGTVFQDGVVLRKQTLAEIRKYANSI